MKKLLFLLLALALCLSACARSSASGGGVSAPAADASGGAADAADASGGADAADASGGADAADASGGAADAADASGGADAADASGGADAVDASGGADAADASGDAADLSAAPVSEEFVQKMNRFAQTTAPRVLNGQGGCYSPASLYTALSLTAQGTGGETRRELCALLGAQPEELARQGERLLRQMSADDAWGTALLANSLWLDREVQGQPVGFREDFLRTAARRYRAAAFTVDFSDGSAGAQIGDWIEEQTRGLLRYVPEASEDRLLALVNTIYYKSPWLTPFAPESTREAPFSLPDGTQKRLPFLHRSAVGGFVRGEDYVSAALPLGKGRVRFWLPDEGVEAFTLLERPALLEETAPEREAELVWSLPRFACDSQWSLSAALRGLGVERAFSDGADFSPMTDAPAHLSSVEQGVHFALDEEGVEAAGYTIELLETTGLDMEQRERVELKLDRPFVYALYGETGAVLFLGVYTGQ